MMTSGSCSSARAIASRRFMPPEKVFTRESARSARLTTSSNLAMRSALSRAGTRYRSAWKAMLACAVSSLYSAVSCGTVPSSCRTWRRVRLASTFIPRIVIVPEVGGMRPLIMLIVVVFPDPLGPSSPNTWPRATSRLSWLTAVNSFLPRPNCLVTSRSAIAADGVVAGAGSSRPTWTGDVRRAVIAASRGWPRARSFRPPGPTRAHPVPGFQAGDYVQVVADSVRCGQRLNRLRRCRARVGEVAEPAEELLDLAARRAEFKEAGPAGRGAPERVPDAAGPPDEAAGRRFELLIADEAAERAGQDVIGLVLVDVGMRGHEHTRAEPLLVHLVCPVGPRGERFEDQGQRAHVNRLPLAWAKEDGRRGGGGALRCCHVRSPFWAGWRGQGWQSAGWRGQGWQSAGWRGQGWQSAGWRGQGRVKAGRGRCRRRPRRQSW